MTVARLAALSAALVLMSLSCGDSPTAPSQPAACTYTATLASTSIPAAGGTTSAHVDTAANCSWTARADAGWITLNPTSGSGPGNITVTAAVNDGTEARAVQLTIAERTMSLRQDGRTPVSCSLTLDPESQTFGPDAGSGRISVRVDGSCAWTARSLDAWLTVKTSTSGGTGNGTVEYDFTANTGAQQREARITVADRTAIVRQDPPAAQACEYAVTPVTVNVCMAGMTVTSTITTGPSCPWTATAGSSWIGITSGSSGTGPGIVSATVTDNYDAPRSGVVMVRWPTPTAGQNVQIAQAGCQYAVSRSSFSFTAAGGSGSFDVLQMADPNTCGGPLQDKCVWSAVASDPWITVTSPMPRSGDNPAAFSVAANPGTAARTGTIRVRDKVVTITQAGA